MARRGAPLALYHIRDAILDFLSIVGDANAEQNRHRQGPAVRRRALHRDHLRSEQAHSRPMEA
jgi:hypothetical protein